MQEFNGIFMLSNFFILSIITILGAFLISFTGLKKVNSVGLRFYVLIALVVCSLVFWTINLTLPTDIAKFGILIFGAVALMCTGIIVAAKKLAVGLSITLKILLVSVLGIFVGSGLLNLGIFYTLFISAVLFVIKKYHSHFIKEQEPYSIQIEIENYNLLPIITDMLSKFDMKVTKKSLTRKEDAVILYLEYQATPIENFLFARNIFRMDGVGEIIKI